MLTKEQINGLGADWAQNLLVQRIVALGKKDALALLESIGSKKEIHSNGPGSTTDKRVGTWLWGAKVKATEAQLEEIAHLFDQAVQRHTVPQVVSTGSGEGDTRAVSVVDRSLIGAIAEQVQTILHRDTPTSAS